MYQASLIKKKYPTSKLTDSDLKNSGKKGERMTADRVERQSFRSILVQIAD